MKALSGGEVRARYLAFFEARGHKPMASDSLVPANDPTLLFTGAGMNQFKDAFLGKSALKETRVTTSQKCLRVPDLENVGVTPRHHTFFEMLGNFSFGDYFKEECIPWEWEFFSKELGIPAAQMVVTVYEDDDEAVAIWRDKVGVPANKIFRLGEKENFWPSSAPSKGPNGVCGPCSEIYFDAFPDRELPTQAEISKLGELPEDRFTEIGNCVFTQFDRHDGGKLVPLPQKNIDVGLGLERIVAVLAGAENNFETDLFTPYLDWLGKKTGVPYGKDPARDVRMRRIADHVRAVTFCIADGAMPSNEGRGYVVRKILRRAARDGVELGIEEPFLFAMVDVVGEVMGEAYPEVREHASACKSLMKSEEESFVSVYRRGMTRVHDYVTAVTEGKVTIQDQAVSIVKDAASGKIVDWSVTGSPGGFAFELHDQFGFPRDIARQALGESLQAEQLKRFEEDFDAAMTEAQRRARDSSATSTDVFAANVAMVLREKNFDPTVFTGYSILTDDSPIQALVGEGNTTLDRASAGDSVLLIAETTPFYAQGGGQVGDRGTVTTATGQGRIEDTTKLDGYHLHRTVVESGHLEASQKATLTVDESARRATERNHTATHLMHAALKEVLGVHVNQAGSEVGPERLRFDFTHGAKVGSEDIEKIERLVLAEIGKATTVDSVVRNLADAKAEGFMALFGEKYGDEVRTLSVGAFSKELCGGTHVPNSGNIGAFRIVLETAVSAGTRRIEAITGEAAVCHEQALRRELDTIAATLKVPAASAVEKVQELVQETKRLRKELAKAQAADLGQEQEKLKATGVKTPDGHAFVYEAAPMAMKELQDLLTRARQAMEPVAGVIFSKGPEGVLVGAVVSRDLTKKVKAGDLVKELTTMLGGGGGGRPEMAQGKGANQSALPSAVARAKELLAIQ